MGRAWMKGSLLGSVSALPAWLRGRGAAKPARCPLAPPFRRKLTFEALEPRILLSADVTPLDQALLAAPLVQNVQPQQPQVNFGAPRAIVFVDPSLTDYQALL